ncbi:hypothetical protein H7J51_05315 [Mycobacterium crocinum]|uniref:Uncharacterized protein n=1 Tax=Mycolicibacterium crocinum TaxID=388459 RepID=A0ABY3TJH0_9MYCO|nr:hypothetical protein [Mycolicibacterium crocinum]MCV7214703.1 hypothetical protein [Mycolicibacterium crocinum]ULN41610.2 hypothetical protein MI149_00125 [Mycolicibacterium crocinum]
MADLLTAVGEWVGDVLATAAHWIGSIPDGVLGAIIGVVATQLVTSVSTYRRRRDEYRAPQRAAIGALRAASNELKVAITAAMDHSGMSGRQTSDDAVVEVQNEFFRRLFGLDQAFEIAFLTVVDGPCYDHLVAAEKPYEALKRIANNPLLSRTDTPAGFTDFMVKLGTASDNLDADLGYLVDLAQQRLRPARRLFSRKPTAQRKPRGRPSIENENRPSPAAIQAAILLSQEQPAGGRKQVKLTQRQLNAGAQPAPLTTRIRGADLTKAHIGRVVVGPDDEGQLNPGKIVELMPLLTDPDGAWIATVHWAGPSGERVEHVKLRFDDDVDLADY